MSRDQQRLADYLSHILEAIDRINRYTQDMDKLVFLSNLLVQDAVVHNLVVIGEASNNIEKHYPDFSADHSELPLSFAYQMRNAVAHGYFKVDFDIVWRTIHHDLPGFYQQVRELAERSPHDDDDRGYTP